jgi:hypothetical protein
MTITLVGKSAGRITAVVETTYEYTAEEDLPARSVVAKSETTGRVLQAQANSWSRMPAIGVTKNAVSAGETVEVYQFGQVTSIRRDSDFSYDDQIFVSPVNAGQVTKTPPEVVGYLVQTIGRAINSSDITLEIDQTVLELTEV